MSRRGFAEFQNAQRRNGGMNIVGQIQQERKKRENPQKSWEPEAPKTPTSYYERPDSTFLDDSYLDIQNAEIEMRRLGKQVDALERAGLRGPSGARIREQYREAQAAYNAAASRFMENHEEYSRQLNAWKGTIRSEEAIQKEMDKIRDQIQVQSRRDATQAAFASGMTPEMQAAMGMTPDVKGGTSAELQGLLEKQRLLKDEMSWRRYYTYDDVRKKEDFDRNSIYQPQVTDMYYRAINRDPVATKWIQQQDSFYTNPDQAAAMTPELKARQAIANGTANRPDALGMWDSKAVAYAVTQLDDDEIKTFDYLYATQGQDAAYKYISDIQESLNVRQRKADELAAKEYAAAHPVLSSAGAVAAAPTKAAAFAAQTSDYLTTGQVDENAWYNQTTNTAAAVQAQVQADLEEKWGPVGSFAYGVGMSMAEFLTNTAITGGMSSASLALMGSGAAAQTTISAKDRGLDDRQAWNLGLIAGAAEIITEKISLDALLDADLLADGTMRYVLKNFLAEGSEEVASDAINTLADMLIAQDLSEVKQSMNAYMKQNKDMTEGEAFGRAMGDVALQMGLSFLGGAISGGIMGSGGAMTQNAQLRGTGVNMQRAGIDQQQVNGMLETALAGENETAQKIAVRIQKKLTDGKKLTRKDLGQLSMAVTRAQDEQIDQAEKERREREKQELLNRSFMGQLTSKWSGRQEGPDIAIGEQQQAADNAPAVTPVTPATPVTAPEAAQQAQTAPVQAEQDSDVVITPQGVRTTRAIQEQAQRIGKAVNREIVLMDDEGEDGYIQNGRYEKGKIYVNVRASDPMAQIVGHELTHSLEGTETYGELLKMVKTALGDNLEGTRQELTDRYAAAGHALEEESDVDHEMVAEYIEAHLLDSESDIMDLVRQKPTIAQRILNAIDTVLAKLGNDSAKDRTYLQKIRSTYAKALKESNAATETEQAQEQTGKQTTAAQEEEQSPEPQTALEAALRRPSKKEQRKAAEAAAKKEQSQQQAKKARELAEMRRHAADMLESGEISEDEYDSMLEAIEEDEAVSGIQARMPGETAKKEPAKAAPQTALEAALEPKLETPATTEESTVVAENATTTDETTTAKGNLAVEKNTQETSEVTAGIKRAWAWMSERSLYSKDRRYEEGLESLIAGIQMNSESAQIVRAAGYETTEAGIKKYLESIQVKLTEKEKQNYETYSAQKKRMSELLARSKFSIKKLPDAEQKGTEKFKATARLDMDFDPKSRQAPFFQEGQGSYLVNATGDLMPANDIFAQEDTFRGFAEEGLMSAYDILYQGRRYTYEEAMLEDLGDQPIKITKVKKTAIVKKGEYTYSLETKGLLEAEPVADNRQEMNAGNEPNEAVDTSDQEKEEAQKTTEAILKEAWDAGMTVTEYLENAPEIFDIFKGNGPHPIWNAQAREALRQETKYKAYEILGAADEGRMGVWDFINQIAHQNENKDEIRYTPAEAYAIEHEEEYYKKMAEERRQELDEARQKREGKSKAKTYIRVDKEKLDWQGKKKLADAKKSMFWRIVGDLSLNFHAEREYMDDIASDLVEGYMETGRITDETKDRLFDRAYDEGWKADMEFLQKNAKAAEYLAGIKITPSEKAKEAANYGKIARNAGDLIAETGGISVEEAYSELYEIDPETFPLWNHFWEVEKLKRIGDIQKGIEKSRRSIENMTGEDYEEMFKMDKKTFDKAIEWQMPSLKQLREFALQAEENQRQKEKLQRQRDGGREDTVAWAKDQLEKGAMTQEEYDGILAAAKEKDQKARQETVAFAEAQKAAGNLTEKEFEAIKATAEGREVEKLSRESITKKAESELKKVVNKTLRSVKEEMFINWLTDKEAVKAAIQEAAEEFIIEGEISADTLDRIFNQVYENGMNEDREFYEQHKAVKGYLRRAAVTVSPEVRKEGFEDWQQFRRNAFGTLRIVNEGGMTVNELYQVAQRMDPELFPTMQDETAQLKKLYQVGSNIRISAESVRAGEAKDGQYYRNWQRKQFEKAIRANLDDMNSVRRVVEEKQAREEKKAQQPKIQTVEEAKEAFANLRKTRRELDKAEARNILTASDHEKVREILAGKARVEDLNPSFNNVKGILDLLAPTREYEKWSKMINEYRDQVRSERRETAKYYLANSINWKDKKIGLAYSRETMVRNLRDIIPNRDEAESVLEEYIYPIQRSNHERLDFMDEMRDRVRDLKLSTKVKPGDQVSEEYATQLHGEAMDNIAYLKATKGKEKEKDGKTLDDWLGIEQDLWLNNPGLDRQKIDRAVQGMRGIYDEIFNKMNQILVENGYEPVPYRKGYFPHFQPDAEEGLMAAYGRILGINTAVDSLPTSINGITETFRPGKAWFSHAQERKSDSTAYGAMEGFDQYIEGAADVIFHTENIQKLRALANEIRYQSTDEGIRQRVDRAQNRTDLSDDDKDALISKIYAEGKFTLSNFINELEEYTNLLANKKSKRDRWLEGDIGRRIYTIAKNFEQRVGANMVAANLGSALTNFIPLTQAWSRLPSKVLLQGMWDTIANIKEPDGKMAFSDFVRNRRGSEPLVQNWTQKAGKIVGKPSEMIDSFTAESIVRAAYMDNIAHGMSEMEAWHQADIFAEGVMAGRAKGEMPTLFAAKNPLMKLFTQFQLEPNNQLSEIFKDMPRAFRDRAGKEIALMIMKMVMGAWIYNQISEKLTGRKPAIDPLSILNDTVGDLTGYKVPNVFDLVTGQDDFHTEKKTTGEALENLGKNVLEDMPFAAALNLIGANLDAGRIPAGAAIPNGKALLDAASRDDWDKKKKQNVAGKELSKLLYVVPPFGGAQLQKTWKGLKAFTQGGSYTYDNEGNKILQYPVYNDSIGDVFSNLLVAGTLGKNATSEARGWAEKGFKSFSANDTAIYRGLLEDGMKDREAYTFVNKLRNVEKTDTDSKSNRQNRMIQQSDLTGEQKATAFYGLLPEESADRRLMEQLTEMGADAGTVADLLIDMHYQNGKKGKSGRWREMLLKAPLSEEEKLLIYRQKVLTDPTSKDADIDTLRQAGLGFDDYLRIQNEYSRIYGLEGTPSKNKALRFSNWLDKQDFDGRQKEAAREIFAYYSMTPVQAGQYNEMVDLGIQEGKAYELAETLDGIKQDDFEHGYQYTYAKWDAVLGTLPNTKDQMRAFKAIMSDSTYEKLAAAYVYGVKPKAYVDIKKRLYDYDENGSGSISKKELMRAMDDIQGGAFQAAMGTNVSNQDLAVLWEIFYGYSKPGRNPYDKEVGTQVYYMLHPDKMP